MTTKGKSVFYDLQEPVKDDFNYIGDTVEEQLKKRGGDLFNDGILGLSAFEISIDPSSNDQVVKFSVGPGIAYVGGRRVEIPSDDTTTYNELNPAKDLLNGECPKSTGCKDVTVNVSPGNDCVTVFLLYAKDYDENVYIIDSETYEKRYTRERLGYAIGYADGTRDNRPVLPKQFSTGGTWVNYREDPNNPEVSWTVGYDYIIIADLLYTGSEWIVDRFRCQRVILKEEVQPSEEVEKHQVTHHTNGISSLTRTVFKYYRYAVKDLLGEGSFRTVSVPISLSYDPSITTTEIYIRVAVSNATDQDLTITIYDPDDAEIDSKTFTFTSPTNIITYSYISTTPFTVGKVSVSSTGSNITVNYKTVNGVDVPKTHTIYRDITDTDTYDEYLPFAIPQLDNNGINQSDCIMIRDTLSENKSFIYVNGKRITRFLFRGIELSSVQWTDNKKYFVLKNLTQTDFGGQTGTFYLVVDENGSIGFSALLDPLKLILAVLDVSYYTDNNWLPGNVGGLSINLADNRHPIDSHKRARLSSYPIEIVPTKDVSDQVEIQLSANTGPLTNIPYLPLKINIVKDDNNPVKSKLVFIGSSNNNILTILDNGNVGIGTNPTSFKLQIDGNTGPNVDNTYDLGSTDYRWRSLYLGSGSLNIDQIGGTNYERLTIGYDTDNNRFQILTTASGTGTLRPLYITTGTNNGITIDTSGNVGIGTSTPSQKLTVNGKLQIGDDATLPSAGTIKWDGSNFLGYNGTEWLSLDVQATSAAGWTAAEGRVYLTTLSDYVGIGTTYPQEKLTLSSDSSFAVEMSVPTGVTASTSSGGTLSGTYYYKVSASDGTGWTVLSDEVSATVDGGITAGTINVSWNAVTGAIKYRVWRGTSTNGQDWYYETTSTSIADNGSLTFTSGTPPTVTTAYVNKISVHGDSWISGSGRVGIGTSLPGNKFGITITSDDTIPTLGSNGGSFALLRKVNNNPGNYGFLMGVLGSGNVFQQAQRIDGSATPYSLLLQPNGGNVGIGITSTPSTRLEVNGDIKASGVLTITGTGSSSIAGNVGIGTTNPNERLEVTGNLNTRGKVKEYGYDLLPRGVIVMWSGSIANIPQGWALCDGRTYTAPDGTQVTTPDLRDKFIVGAGGSYSVGATGGEAFHTLTVGEMPNHSHGVSDPGHTHSYPTPGPGGWGLARRSYFGEDTTAGSRDTIGSGYELDVITSPSGFTVNSSSTGISIQGSGGNLPHENRPPYYALAFIMKL